MTCAELQMKGLDVENRDGNYALSRISGTATVIGGTAQRRAELGDLARISGLSLLPDGDDGHADCLLVDLSSKMETRTDSLSKIVRYLESHRSIALVWMDMDGLDEAFATLPQDQCHFLVDANDIEAMPILAGAWGRGGMNRLHDRNREIEFGSLHRISDELAEFARTLSKMAESDGPNKLADKPVSFRPAPAGVFQAFAKSVATPPSIDAKALREIIKRRRLRERFFETELFADPAWDILLDLKAAALERQNVSVSSLCIAAAVPPTTALRWITAMTQSGLLVRRQDPDDARRVFIELSDETSAKLDDYFCTAGPTSGLEYG